MGRFTTASAVAALVLSTISPSFASDIPSCGPGKLCPEDAPCCSQYGQCGAGAYCLGGCDPLFSHDLSSCVPSATCKSEDYKLTSLDDVASIDKYLGDWSNINWVASGSPAKYSQGGNNGILLTMGEDTVGTLMATTHYVWYGKICATMRTSQGQGVVTAFIMMSDVKDEIDFEFIGVDINHAQSNFYSQGVTNYNNEVNLTVNGDTVSKDHTYCVDWKPDTLTWSVDDKDMRTLKRDDTWNNTANRFDYPQTPARAMLSLWPAGLASNGKGTIEWSGGEIQWDSPYMSDGYYYALVKEVTVECYDPPSGAQVAGSKSYTYTDTAGTNNTIKITDDQVILKSLYASGDNPDLCPDCAKSSASASASKGSSTKTSSSESSTPTVQTVPGVVGSGGRGQDAESASAAAAGSEATGSSTSSGDGSSSSGSSSGDGGFDQGGSGTDSGDSSGAAGAFKGTEVGGSALAVIVALAAMLVL